MSGTPWNPNNPAVAGLEWFPIRLVRKPLTPAAGIGALVASTAAESIASVSCFAAGDVPFQNAQIGVDVYDASAVWSPGQIIGALSLPSENAGNSAGFDERISGVPATYDTSAHNYIDVAAPENADPATVAAGSTTRIGYVPSGGISNGHIHFRAAPTYVDVVTGAAGPDPTVAGKRIAWLEIVTILQKTGPNPSIDGNLLVGGAVYGSPGGAQAVSVAGERRLTFRWYFNPSTGEQWTQGDLAQFQTGGTGRFGLQIAGSSPTLVSIVAINFVIRYLTDKRVATGYAVISAVTDWNTIPLRDPATNVAANWAKANATNYLFVYYSTGFLTGASLNFLDSGNLAGHENDQLGGWQGASLVTHSPVIPTANPVLSKDVPAMFMTTAGGPIGVDAQPYATTTTTALSGATGTTKQVLAPHGSATYGIVSVVLGGALIPNADLTLSLHKVSDDSQVGGSAVIGAEEVPTDGKYHLFTRELGSPPALLTGTAYYLLLSSPGTIGWELPVAYTRAWDSGTTAIDTFAAGGAIGGSGTYNGTTDATLDLLTNVTTVPSPPSGLTAVQQTIANRPALTGSPVIPGLKPHVPTTIGYAHLAWTATSLGATFGYYEVQRLINGVFQPIVLIGLESSNYFNDIEGVRGLARQYRVRVVRADGAFSDWTATVSVTITVQDCADVCISSNLTPDSSLAFVDLSPTHSFDQLQTAHGKIQPISGRDYPVAFWPAESGGEAFTRVLSVAFNDLAVGTSLRADRSIFDPLVALIANRTLPYLSYSDSNGDEWLVTAAIQSPGLQRVEPGGQYTATILFTQVASVPVALVVAVPTVP